MTYDGLNNLLQAEDSLAAGTRTFTSSTEFDVSTDLPTNYIGSANIRNFNFSQGQGGTLTLGGTVNGDGILTVNNNVGSSVVSLNNSGITVNNGSIAIYNSSGSAIIDSLGLNSVNNFITNATTGDGTVVGTTEVPLPGGTIGPIVLTRDTNFLIDGYFYGRNTNILNDNGAGYPSIYDGTTLLLFAIVTTKYWITDVGTVRSSDYLWFSRGFQMSAGTHNIVLKCYSDEPTGTIPVQFYFETIQNGY